ncbi:MAG: fasciclin domain-containing protein, partial [Pseudomonadota bacterium]
MLRRTTLKAAAAVAALALAGCAAETSTGGNTIVDVASGAGTFDTLVAAVAAADLVDTLSSPGPFTVFAPTDEAFAALPEGTVETLLLPENKDQLVSILTYHVVSGQANAADFPAGARSSVATVQGGSVIVDTRHGVTVNGATVVTPDIAASNGVIHVIDEVLL